MLDKGPHRRFVVLDSRIQSNIHVNVKSRTQLEKNKYLFKFIYSFLRSKSAVLSSAVQNAMPPEFGGKWETECHKTRFPIPDQAGCGIQREAKFGVNLVVRNTARGIAC